MLRILVILGALLLPSGGAGAQDFDRRQLVKLPPYLRDHFLAGMRDHLATLDNILAHIAAGKAEEAAAEAEQNLGLSAIDMHVQGKLVPYLPPTMRELGVEMQQAASRFAVAIQRTRVEQTQESLRWATGALHEVTLVCRACHATYRVR
ncbi:MAG: hypothetical protein HZC25_04380 [Rhodospirillales bacterium]|nr:hypothetical protein [Rhodospirillales bacterium]